jgi:hypothetical protein
MGQTSFSITTIGGRPRCARPIGDGDAAVFELFAPSLTLRRGSDSRPGCSSRSIFWSICGSWRRTWIGSQDQDALVDLLRAQAPIDGFGIGRSLTTSSDLPAIHFVYKLQEYAGALQRKRSDRKATWPGRK